MSHILWSARYLKAVQGIVDSCVSSSVVVTEVAAGSPRIGGTVSGNSTSRCPAWSRAKVRWRVLSPERQGRRRWTPRRKGLADHGRRSPVRRPNCGSILSNAKVKFIAIPIRDLGPSKTSERSRCTRNRSLEPFCCDMQPWSSASKIPKTGYALRSIWSIESDYLR